MQLYLTRLLKGSDDRLGSKVFSRLVMRWFMCGRSKDPGLIGDQSLSTSLFTLRPDSTANTTAFHPGPKQPAFSCCCRKVVFSSDAMTSPGSAHHQDQSKAPHVNGKKSTAASFWTKIRNKVQQNRSTERFNIFRRKHINVYYEGRTEK